MCTKKIVLLLLAAIVLSGCAANNMPGYQNVYQRYDVPEVLVTRIKEDFRRFGLNTASVKRDNTGRIQLIGSYKNEDDVDLAFSIVQNKVGLKSTSPFYPEDVKESLWEREMNQALAARKNKPSTSPKKYALIIGVGHYKYESQGISSLPGKLDTDVAVQAALKSGYEVIQLVDEQATKANIEREIDKLDKIIAENDYLFIYVSSHGYPTPSKIDPDESKMRIVVYDTKMENDAGKKDAKIFMNSSVSDRILQKIISRPTKLTRILVDTCYSGNIWQDKSVETAAYIKKVNGGKPDFKAASANSYRSKALFLNDGTQSKQTTTTSKSTGKYLDLKDDKMVVITATGPNGEESIAGRPNENYAFEGLGNGRTSMYGSFFTQAFFYYLDQHKGQMEPAFRDAQKFTSGKVRELSLAGQFATKDKTQTPQMSPEIIKENHFTFAN